MHDHLRTTLERLVRVQRDRIEPAVHRRESGVTLASWLVADDGEPVTPQHAIGTVVDEGRTPPDYQPFSVGDGWGEPWATRWFRVEGQVPEASDDPVELLLDLGWFDHSVGGHCEALAFTSDGIPVKGLHPRQRWIRLLGDGARPGIVDADGSFTLYIEAAANPLLLGLPPFVITEHGEKNADEAFEQFRLRTAEVAVFRDEVFQLSRDLDVAGGLASTIGREDPRHWRLLRGVEEALDAYDERDAVTTAVAARAILAPVLAHPANASAHQITAVGHAHMDSAWLWPVRETVRKLARTVSNALALLDTDDSLVYTMTSAQHFTWLEEHYPDLFARVAAYVEAGRFVPVGGMWVEVDGVMPTGESFVRQILLGKRYFQERFGLESREIWLPDSFGYSGALPQLAERSGADAFLTQKISWNDTTTFPHHSFWWEGIDGTRVFTHFPPSDTYAASVTADELSHSVANFKDKAIASHSLLAYGYGDGGGGPTREMAARLSRFRDLEGAPRIESQTPEDFFTLARDELRDLPTTSAIAPVWRGELYLELHRGSLTSQQAMKRGNRRSEALLRLLEHAASAASLLADTPYPAARLEKIWQDVLLHQFHDILPGTSIAWVHREARDEYARLERELLELVTSATDALEAAGELTTASDTTDTTASAPGTTLATTAEGGEDDGDDIVLDNGVLRVVIAADGYISSLVHLADDVEVVSRDARLGELQLFRDEPVRWDAWDLDRHVLRHPRPIDDIAEREIVVDGDDRGVRVLRRVGASTIETTMWLRSGADLVETECDIDWQEREQLLKVAFPVDVRATTARFETQYGYVERPMHTNTAADEAMFEASVQRYIHVSDGARGVAILNRAICGADARTDDRGVGSVVRLSLLRGARFPDPDADLGRHHLSWAVRPGARHADVVDAATAYVAPAERHPGLPELVGVENTSGHLVVDWIKQAADGSGDLIARVYETDGAHARGRLTAHPALAGRTVVETDLIERPFPEDGPPRGLVVPDDARADGSVPLDGAELRLSPFQITTLRITTPTS